MEQKYSMQVNAFADKYVKTEYRKEFFRLMVEWDADGWQDGNKVGLSFYDFDLLQWKYEESKGV